MVIKGMGGAPTPAATGRAQPNRPTFDVAAERPPAAARTASPAALDGLLLLQETTDTPARDRRARQHGRALLDALARLQLALLGDGGGEQAAQHLAALAETSHEAADPALQSALGAIVLRARIELARRQL